jgi:hypothetical protein
LFSCTIVVVLLYYMSKSPKKPVSNLVECQICHVHYQLKGIGRHRIACAREHNSGIQQKEFLKKKSKESKTRIPRGITSSSLWSNVSRLADIMVLLAALVGPTSRSVAKPWEKFGRLGN